MENTAHTDIRRAAEALKIAHGQTLGAIEAELKKLTETQAEERRVAEAAGKRKSVVAQTQARNAVVAAQAAARSSAGRPVAGTAPQALRVAEYLELGELTVNARPVGINSPLDVPLVVPLFGSGSITVVGAGTTADSLIRNIQVEALEGTSPGQLALAGYDPDLANPLSPFAPVGAAVEGAVRTLHSQRDLDTFIDETTRTVAKIGDLLMGSPDGLIEHRAAVGLPVEQYLLISMHNYPTDVEEQQHQRLMALARSAPRHGLAFVFHVPDPRNLPAWMSLDELRGLGESFDVSSTRVTWARKPHLLTSLPDVTPLNAASIAETVAARAKDASLPSIPFSDIQPTYDWGQSSARSVTFAIGRTGHKTVEITLGDERVNALITGAVGQGKSNLLKVIVHSLCSRYAPEELSLYLLDMKEGVTLAPMVPTSESPGFLPHAKVLGLEADKDFGVSVLSALIKEYRRRSKLMKSANVDKLADYRSQNPDIVMPRIVLIVDEFHLLLTNDPEKAGAGAAKALEDIVRLGRASGIHVILASQSISGIATLLTTGQGIFAQFPIRLGLKNSPKEAIAFFGQGNEAISRLRFRGEVVLNLDHGAVEANQTVMVAAAEDRELAKLRDHWYRKADTSVTPLVFDGSKPSSLLDDRTALVKAKDTVKAGGPARVYVGRPVAVDSMSAAFVLEPTPGKNLAVIGASSSSEAFDDSDNEPDNMAIGVLQAAGTALALQHGAGTADFVVLDLLTDRDRAHNNMASWFGLMETLGHNIEIVAQRDVKEWLFQESARLASRNGNEVPRYVFGFALDRVGPIEIKEGVRQPASRVLQSLLRQGPTVSEHFLLWWSDPSVFLTHMERKVDPFNGSLLLRGVDEALTRFHGVLANWDATDNRGLFGDTTDSERKRKVIPYQPLTTESAEQLRVWVANGQV